MCGGNDGPPPPVAFEKSVTATVQPGRQGSAMLTRRVGVLSRRRPVAALALLTALVSQQAPAARRTACPSPAG